MNSIVLPWLPNTHTHTYICINNDVFFKLLFSKDNFLWRKMNFFFEIWVHFQVQKKVLLMLENIILVTNLEFKTRVLDISTIMHFQWFSKELNSIISKALYRGRLFRRPYGGIWRQNGSSSPKTLQGGGFCSIPMSYPSNAPLTLTLDKGWVSANSGTHLTKRACGEPESIVS
jgi:hypothetical protein